MNYLKEWVEIAYMIKKPHEQGFNYQFELYSSMLHIAYFMSRNTAIVSVAMLIYFSFYESYRLDSKILWDAFDFTYLATSLFCLIRSLSLNKYFNSAFEKYLLNPPYENKRKAWKHAILFVLYIFLTFIPFEIKNWVIGS
jgi:hypothetical protein